jgi:AcrR family transcriptional regulator
MRKTDKESKLSTREKVMNASLMLFAEKGLEGTTTKMIAAEAGVNEVTLFRIFGNKEALFHAVIIELLPVKTIQRTVDFDMEGPLDAVMVKNAQGVLAVLQENRHIIMMMFGELWRHPELSEPVSQKVMAFSTGFLADIFEKLMRKGVLRRTDPQNAARSWIGMIQSYFIFNYLLRSTPPSPQEEEIILRGYVDVFLNGMRGESQ